MSSNPPRGFSPAEFAQRTARAQRLMAEHELDVLFLSTEAEVRYFSGYLTQFWQSPTRPWFLLIPRSGAPIAVVPGIGEALMRSTWIEDIRCWPSPQPDDEGISLVSEALREVGGDAARIGIPQGDETHVRMPLRDFYALQANLPHATWHDATAIIRALRMVKSDAEIAKIQHICSIASRAFDDAPDLFHEGLALNAAFRAFKVALLNHGADDVSYLVGAAGMGGYSNVISPPDDTPLQLGDVLMLDTGAVFDGYFCDFDRNFAIGTVADETLRAHDTLYRATEAGKQAIKPGATCHDVFWAMARIIEADGYGGSNVGRMGHGLGTQLTEWPSICDSDHTVIEQGMVLTLEPGVSIDAQRMLVHEENLVVNADGATWLSQRATNPLVTV